MSKFLQLILFILVLLFIAHSVSNFGHKLENFEAIKKAGTARNGFFMAGLDRMAPLKLFLKKISGSTQNVSLTIEEPRIFIRPWKATPLKY